MDNAGKRVSVLLLLLLAAVVLAVVAVLLFVVEELVMLLMVIKILSLDGCGEKRAVELRAAIVVRKIRAAMAMLGNDTSRSLPFVLFQCLQTDEFHTYNFIEFVSPSIITRGRCDEDDSQTTK